MRSFAGGALDETVDGSVDRAVILAAGLGTRLKWLTEQRPKALMQVAGEPAIVHVIRRLARQGIRHIAVNLHHHAGALEAVLGDGSRFGVSLYYSREAALLDSGGGVRKAMQLLPGRGPILVHNADIISDLDVRRLLPLLAGNGCALALVPNPDEHPDGDFALSEGRVYGSGRPRLTFSGISLWRDEVLLPLAVDQPWSLVHPMRVLMRQGRCAGLLHRGMWFDIGKPRSLMQANRYLIGGG